jgi:hypothetical protein
MLNALGDAYFAYLRDRPAEMPEMRRRDKIFRFIETHQADVIERILKHCNLWIEPRDRGPPVTPTDNDLDFELQYVGYESRTVGETRCREAAAMERSEMATF